MTIADQLCLMGLAACAADTLEGYIEIVAWMAMLELVTGELA